MAESIHINPEELETQVKVLNKLSNSTELADKIKDISENYVISSGESSEAIKDINNVLLEISKQMQLIFTRTSDFLSNTSTHFVEADNNVSKAIEEASITKEGGN